MKNDVLRINSSNFFYPSLCLHCEKKIDHTRLICNECAPFFELIEPSTRCPYCFVENGRRKPCRDCIEQKRWGFKTLSALEYIGPVHSLVQKLKYGRVPYLAKTAAAFMITQLLQSNWPMPDLIIPIPLRLWFHGENHALLLARELGKRLKCPVKTYLGRRVGSLELEFYLRKSLTDQTVLIVDDVTFTGATFRGAAEVLAMGGPRQLYALSLAYSNINV